MRAKELWWTACVPTATELDAYHCKIDGEEEVGAARYAPLPLVVMGQSSLMTTYTCISYCY